VRLEAPACLRLVFKGVSHTAEVFWNGERVGRHYNAYTPFSVSIPDVPAGEHELYVRADNRFTADSALHFPNDYYSYGGLIRPVVLEKVAEVFLEHLHVVPFRQGET